MNTNYTLINVVGWIFIYLVVFVEYTFQRENKIPREYGLNSNSFKKALSFRKSRNAHNKTERQTLLREFVLGDFSPYNDDTPDEEDNSFAEIRNDRNDVNSEAPKILKKNEIKKQRTHKELIKSKTTRLKNKRNGRNKVQHKKSKSHYKKKWENYHSYNKPLKENKFSSSFNNKKQINHFRPEKNKNKIKSRDTKISKSQIPFEYYDNFPFGNSLEDNYDFSSDENYYDGRVPYDINNRSWRENDHVEDNEVRFKEPKTSWLQNLKQKSYKTIKTSTQNPIRKARKGRVINKKQVQQKRKLNRNKDTKIRENKLGRGFLNENSMLGSDRKNILEDNNNGSEEKKRYKSQPLRKDYYQNMDATNHNHKSSIKCIGNCSFTRKRKSQMGILCNESKKALENPWCKYENGSQVDTDTNESSIGKSRKNEQNFSALLKSLTQDHQVNKLETLTITTSKEGGANLHNSTLHSYNREKKLAVKPKTFAEDSSTEKGNKNKQNNTTENNALFQQMLNIPVKLIVNLFRKYVFGEEDPGELLLKDLWQLPSSNRVSKTNVKTKVMNLNQTRTKTNPKVSKKIHLKTMLKERHKSKASMRRLRAKLPKESNPVTRTFSSNKPSTLKRKNESIELIDVLIDGRFLDNNNKYLNDVYKKSLLPEMKEGDHFPRNNIFLNSVASNKKQDLPKSSNTAYFIPLTRNPEISADRKNKELLEKAPFDFNVKRSEIYYPGRSVSSNQFRSKYKTFYDNTQIPPNFEYPWNVGDNQEETQKDRLLPQYSIQQDNRLESKDYSNIGEEKQKQYYRQYLTLQETAREPPPYTFQIYEGDHQRNDPSWNKFKPMKDKRNQNSKYKGIFGNKDDDLQSSCTNLGKQDYIEFCPKDWVSFKQFCFSLNEETHGWSEIPDICSRKNGKMAMPKSQEVIEFLVDQLSSKKQYTKPFFVGLRKIDEEWEWIDDTPLSQGLSDQIESNFHSCAVIQEGSLRKKPCDFKSGYICEMKIGIEASRLLTFGDSLTKGYFNAGKSFHPYGAKLEVLLNKDDHRCFALDVSAKNGEQSDHMLQRLSDYLNMKQRTYNWVLILAGTNDLLMSDSPSDKIADQIVIMHEVVHARGAKSLIITIPEIFCERTNCKHMKQRRQAINKRLRMYAAAAGSKAYLSDLALKISLHQLSLEDRRTFWEPSGVHLKQKGYDKMAQIIFKDLMESIESPFA